MFLEIAVGAARRIAAIEADRLVLPFPLEAEVAPGADVVLESAIAILREDRVDLLQRQLFQGIVLVHEDGEHVDRRGQNRRWIAVLGLEGVDLRRLPLTAHGAERARALDQGRRRGGRALAFDPLLHAGIELLEAFGPVGHEIVHGVGADALQRPGDLARHLRVGGDFHIGRPADAEEGDQAPQKSTRCHVTSASRSRLHALNSLDGGHVATAFRKNRQ